MAKQPTPSTKPQARRVWIKPSLRVHGDLATLTRAKNPNGLDSGLGTQIS